MSEDSSDPFELVLKPKEKTNDKRGRRGPNKKTSGAVASGTVATKKARVSSQEKAFLKSLQSSSGKFLYYNIRHFFLKNNFLDDEHKMMLMVALDRDNKLDVLQIENVMVVN